MGVNRRQIFIIVSGFIALAVFFLWPRSGGRRTSFIDPFGSATGAIMTLSGTLDEYSGANEGRFPAKLVDLTPEYLPRDASCLQFLHPRTKRSTDWIYFGGHSIGDPPDTIIVAAPETVSKADGTPMVVGPGAFRLVLSIDGKRALLTESDYQSCIAEQQRPEWTKRESGAFTWDFLADAPELIRKAMAKIDAHKKERAAKSVTQLIDDLKSEDERTRSHAAEYLGELGAVTPEVLPALREALHREEMGYEAAHALAKISLTDPTVVPALLDVLKSGKMKASYWAAVALEDIGPTDEAAVPLLDKALEDAFDDLHVSAARALGRIGPGARSAVPALIRSLNGKDEWTVKCSAIALGRIGAEAREAIPALTAGFEAGGDFQIDFARALWKIDPGQSARVIPALIAKLEGQRNGGRPLPTMDAAFVSAIHLLGEIGPDARAAIPILQTNLRGAAWLESAWALRGIDPQFSETATQLFIGFLTTDKRPSRLDRLAQGDGLAQMMLGRREDIFGEPFAPRLAAAGALWQMHPEKREALKPYLVALLREWETNKVLKELTASTRLAIPALEHMEKAETDPQLRLLTREARREIAGTDYGEWF